MTDAAETAQRSRSLAVRSILGAAALAAALGVALFAPAGTFAYWQAWLYLLVFFGAVAVITVYLWREDPALLERRVQAGPVAEQQASQRVIQSVAAVAFIGVMVVPALDQRFGWSHVWGLVSIAADVLVGVGFWIVFRVFRANTYTAATIGVAGEQQVVSTGPYAVVRHPMYAGALLLLAATPLALGSWWGVLAVLVLLGALVWRLADEERYLVAHLDGYAEYRTRVRYRLVPGVW